jgi:hypothetical protein
MSLSNYIVDLRKPPDGKFKLENLYVMLSRATTWEAFAILCPFEDCIFTEAMVNIELQQYNDYLDRQSCVSYQSLINEHSYIASL